MTEPLLAKVNPDHSYEPGPALGRRRFDGFEDRRRSVSRPPILMADVAPTACRNNEGLPLKRRRRPDHLQQIPAAGVGHSNVIDHHVGAMLLNEPANFLVGLWHVRN